MTTMEISASTNGNSAINSLSTNKTSTEHSLSNDNRNSTVCYLSNGPGQIDRLSLVLPLTNKMISPYDSYSSLSTSPPFSSHVNNEIEHIRSDVVDSDSDRTPINCEQSFLFSPTDKSCLSSCRTIDSGAESLCSETIDDQFAGDFNAERILEFFATDKSKSSRYGGRRPTGGNRHQLSVDNLDKNINDDNDDGNEDEDIYSDESTLSESSASPQDLVPDRSKMITPESVVAAIDAQIKQREAMVSNNGDKKQQQPSNSGIKCDIVDKFSVKDESDTKSTTGWCIPSEVDDDLDYEDDCPRGPLIRSTSLKTGKTPPGTPRGKKIVRFADVLGLDLESVRHIVDDGPYMPPLAAFKGLKLDEDDKQWLFGQRGIQTNQSVPRTIRTGPSPCRPNLRIMFGQPSSDPGPFMERVRSFKICLENCLVTGPSGPSDMFTITNIVRVLNIGFEKSVMLRYTTNEWLTWTDVLASYVPNSCDGFSDKFSVTFHLAVNSNGHQAMMPGQRLLFALKYRANGDQEYWDNNMGLNYPLIYQRT